MKLYFLRHGNADWPEWEGSDDERPLTKKGREEMRKVAAFLRALKVRPDQILSSPLPRAYETAVIAAKKLKRKVLLEPALAKDFNAKKLDALLKKFPADELMLVGHEPNFSEVLKELTGGRVKLAKAGLACVDLDGEESTLVWLLPPRAAKI